MRQLYHSRRDRLLEQIEQRLSPWITPIASGGGLQITVKLKGQQNEARLTAMAAHRGLLLPRLSPLYAGPASQQGWMLGFAALTPDEIVAGCDRLLEVLKEG